MDSVSINAYAKINLFLEVCDKRHDSYHNIDSIMHTVSLHDVVTVSKSNNIVLSNNKGLPNDESNLAYKAAMNFFEFTRIEGGAEIHIEKNIPISAGLAGGSTDAAVVLKALNAIYETGIGVDTLCGIGAKMGADIPFCIKGGCYITRGIGDVFTPCASLPDCWIVISKMGDGVSTPYAYSMIDSSRLNNELVLKNSDVVADSLASRSLKDVSERMYNVFESVVCPVRPKVAEQKKIMIKNGALNAMMSGSGPSVFGLFDNEALANKALNDLLLLGADAHICKPI